MKAKEILSSLYKVQSQKTKLKRLVQTAFDELHLLETTTMLLIQDLQQEVKRKKKK